MKKYRVKVNGKVYEVELEEVASTEGKVTSNDKVEKPTQSDVKVESNKGHKVLSFMQGVIVDIKVKENTSVTKGQTLAILEAMKMENEIVAPVSGVVSKIFVSKQDPVENQEVIMIIN